MARRDPLPIPATGDIGKVLSVEYIGGVPGYVLEPISTSSTAGGVLTGTYPNPGFAVDMATQAELDAVGTAKANLASPALTGNPTAPTPAVGDNGTSIATTAFVRAEMPQAFSPMQFGAVGDGATDDSAAINAAIDASDALAAVGGRLGPPIIIDRAYLVNSPIFLQKAPLVGYGKRGEINAGTAFSGGNHVIRNWQETDYAGTESNHDIPPVGGDYSNHYFVLQNLRVGCGLVPDLGGVSLCAVHETSIFKNLTFSAPATSGAGNGSIGFHLSGTTGQGINGKVGLDDFTFYGVGWKTEIKIGASDTSTSGSEVNVNRWTSAPGVHQGSCIDIGVTKVTLNDFHIECYVDPALVANTDLAIIRYHNPSGFSIIGSNIQINPTSLTLKHPAIYTSNSHTTGSGMTSPIIVNLTQTAGSGTGWDPTVPWIKDNSNASNIQEIAWASGNQNPIQVNYYDGNIYSRQHPSSGVGSLSFLNAPAADHARVRRTTAQTISDNATTNITFESVIWDSAAFWSAGTPQRVTIPATAVYSIKATVAFTSNSTGIRQLYLRRNASNGSVVGILAEDTRNAVVGDVTMLQLATDYELTAGEYLDLIVKQTSGGSLDTIAQVSGDRYNCQLTIQRLGPLA